MNKDGANSKESVRIRFRNLADGSQSIYLDCYYKGKREYRFLNIYLKPEKGRESKAWNKQQIALAEAIKAQTIVDMQNGKFGFRDTKAAEKTNFIAYLEEMLAGYEAKGQTACANLMKNTIRRLIAYKGKLIPISGVTKEYLIGFIDFLNAEGNSFDKKSKDPERQIKPLSGVYKEAMYNRIMVALNKAEREGIILRNPGKNVDSSLRPRAEESKREYLTLEEVKAIINTTYTPKNHIKQAFLFCCFSGLRYSDIYKLTWGEIKIAQDGEARIETRMKKTKKDVYIPLSENALAWLPERENMPDEARIFYLLPDQSGNADARLRTLVKHAGITKRVSFHVGRHTFATLTLTYGADLYTVSKLLGHCNIRTTQIYAKIVDENKRKAVNLIPKI